MITRLALFSAAALLAACGGIPQATPPQWGYTPSAPAPSVISESEAQQLTEQLISTRGQRDTLVNNLPRVTDAGTRAEHVRSIGTLNERIQLYEYRLRSAGRPVR